MIAVIDGGGSVMLNGVNISNKNREDLPTEAELAKGDKVKEAAAKVSLEAQQQEIAKQLALLADAKKEDKNVKVEATKPEEKAKGVSAVAN